MANCHHVLTKAMPIMMTPKPNTMNESQMRAPTLRRTMLEGSSYLALAFLRSIYSSCRRQHA